ncbi:MAG: hypothetical protein GXO09_02045 [Crenarchaeota archaeon]|nr:hypothetical protein [Thermoproteota archaeon]
MSTLVYMKYYMKSWMTSKPYWFWSVAFMTIWMALGYVSADRLAAAPLEARLAYTAGWYVVIVGIGIAAAAVGLSRLLFYSSIPVRYLSKYSMLTSRKLYAYMFTGFIIVCLITAAVLAAMLLPLYSSKLGAVAPKNPLGLAAAVAGLGALYFSIDVVTTCAAILARAARSAEYVAYLPLILGMALTMLQLNTSLGKLFILASPINAATALLFSYYTGMPPTTAAIVEPMSGVKLDPALLWASVIAWTGLLSCIGIVLLRLQRGVGAEEIRLL